MRAKLAALSLFVFIGAGICSAQTAPPQASYSTVYCSGFVSDQKVPDASRLVSGDAHIAWAESIAFCRPSRPWRVPTQ